MRPEPSRREEGAFDVGAQDARAAAALDDLGQGGDQPVLRSGDQGGEVGRDARLEQRLARSRVAFRVGVEEVDAAEAVDLEVDEAGNGETRAAGSDADTRDAAVDEIDASLYHDAVDERGGDPESHDVGASEASTS
jgi:hypothetical protein